MSETFRGDLSKYSIIAYAVLEIAQVELNTSCIVLPSIRF